MKSIILKVSDSVSERDAIDALVAAGLDVEQRLPVAFYMDEDGADPIYSIREWLMRHAAHATDLYTGAQDLYTVAEACDAGGCTIVDEIWLKAADRDAIRAELAEILDELSPENVTVAGFSGRKALTPLLVVDGVSVQCDLGHGESSRYADSVDLGSAVDAANGRDVTVTFDNEAGRIVVAAAGLEL